jgi:methyltransferase (TIGR00027 family)
MHVEADPPPHLLVDDLGRRLIAHEGPVRLPPGMSEETAGRLRASIVLRARYIEDLVIERAALGIRQYIILGAGLDTFAQRRAEVAERLTVFEVDRPGPQAWKRQRLIELGFGIPTWLRLVPFDFESGRSWKDALVSAGFAPDQPAVVSSSGVSMYLTRDAIMESLQQCATLAPGSVLVMSFGLRPALLEPEDRPARGGPEAAFTYFSPTDMLELAREAGFRDVQHVSTAALTERYLAGRSAPLQPSEAQDLLVATT